MEGELICQGAEGRVYGTEFFGRPAIIKQRLSKSYRVAELDKKINKQRLLQEARCIVKCRRAGVATPSIYLIDIEGNKLYLERIMGKTFKDMLWSHHSETEANCKREEFIVICKEIGDLIGKLHNAEVVHGDLTTSNIMVRTIATQLNVPISPSEETSSHSEAAVTQAVAPAATVNESAHTPGKVVLIDFGLGMMKPSVDDKAVDLYVLERAFIATHPGSEHLVQAILDAYRFSCRKGTSVLQKLEQVRQRGRKREMIG